MEANAVALVPFERMRLDLAPVLLARQQRREQDAVVVAARLRAEHGDVVHVRRFGEQLLDRAHRGHAVTHDDQATPPRRGGRQARRHATALDPHAAVEHAAVPGAQRDRLVLDAAARLQAEMLLVDRRGDDQLVLEIPDDAAREHVRAAERIEVLQREERVADAEDRDLLVIDQRADAGAVQDVVHVADELAMVLQLAHDATSASWPRAPARSRAASAHAR